MHEYRAIVGGNKTVMENVSFRGKNVSLEGQVLRRRRWGAATNWNAQNNSAFFPHSPHAPHPCFRKQWKSYPKSRRTSVKCRGCTCSATYPSFVWLEKTTRKCSISGVQRSPLAVIPFINILFLPSDKEFSKSGKHCLFYNLVPTSLYTRQFVSLRQFLVLKYKR